MRTLLILIITVMILAAFTLASAAGNAGSVENGKKLYNDSAFAGSPNPKSCNTCHPNGRGLEQAGTKKYTALMGIKATSLEDIVNICIKRPLMGKPIAHDSQQMRDIVTYIKSLGK